MGKSTGIAWCDSTWNPIRGCSRVSEGCRNCYAERVAGRFSGRDLPYEGLASLKIVGEGSPEEHIEARWTGEVRFIEKRLNDPIRWKTPSRIFVNSMSDLFHPGVAEQWITDIFRVMARAPQHKYIVLTKRPERMRDVLRDPELKAVFQRSYGQQWPPPNWWFGVSVEDQETADHRIPILLQCPSAIRFISYEPALGPVNFAKAAGGPEVFTAIDWLIVGGESGPRARPMHPNWAREARDLCSATGVKFFFKQWGSYSPNLPPKRFAISQGIAEEARVTEVHTFADGLCTYRVSNLKAMPNLDGVEWKEFPQC
jgi:protein gp37